MYGEGVAFGTREYSLDYQKQFTDKPSWNRDNWEKFIDYCIIIIGILLFIVAIPIILLWIIFGGE